MSLAYLKRMKNFRALEKGYPQEPEEHYDYNFLLARVEQELQELKEEFKIHLFHNDKWSRLNAKKECADVSNLIDFIFEKLEREES